MNDETFSLAPLPLPGVFGPRFRRNLYVPDDHATIQAAIDAAGYGDTVIVPDGEFYDTGNRDINFLGKEITVASENGPWNTTINCEHSGRGFRFRNRETYASMREHLKERPARLLQQQHPA